MANPTSEKQITVKGFVKKVRKAITPPLPVLPQDTEETLAIRREARHIAIQHRHKPWARRYLRQIGRLA